MVKNTKISVNLNRKRSFSVGYEARTHGIIAILTFTKDSVASGFSIVFLDVHQCPY